MKTRNIFLSLLLASTLLIGSAFSEAYWGLNIDSDVATQIDESVAFGHATDLNFTFGYKFSEKVAAEVYLTWTTGDYADLPAGRSSTDQFSIGSGSGAAFAFDGATIMWEITDWLSVDIFDYVAAAGASSYYWLKGQDLIIPISYPRGAQAHWGLGDKLTLSTGFGVDASGADEYMVNTSLTLAKDEESDWGAFHFAWEQGNGKENYTFLATGIEVFIADWLTLWGSVIDTELSPVGVGFSGGAEGSVGIGEMFSIAYAVMGGNQSASRLQLGTRFTETFLTYVEPGVTINDYVAFGLPLEYHIFGNDDDYNTAIDAAGGTAFEFVEQQFWMVPTLYLYPAEGVEIWLWYQAAVGFGDNYDAKGIDTEDQWVHFAGLEAIFEF